MKPEFETLQIEIETKLVELGLSLTDKDFITTRIEKLIWMSLDISIKRAAPILMGLED